uniref:LOG family protein n=1 Tax=Staphylococcus epidermidis TaxID=1282 RepID=UPI0016424D4F
QPQITSQKLTHLILLHSIHHRKNKITQLPHPFIIPPRPPPSLQQFFQIYTSPQIPIHQNPIPLFNLNPFFHPLQHLIHHIIKQPFIHDKYQKLPPLYHTKQSLIQPLKHYKPLPLPTYH